MIFFLFFTTLISYGQMLLMGVWQDDNAIFFKLQHINETAGFFGRGLIGEGPYRFSFTPYWFIYKLFGQNSTLPYYLLIFIFYFLSAFAIYKFVSTFVSKKAGRIAGLLFACGFIASDGFFWLANAMVADVSIILLCLSLLFYFKFYLKKTFLFYVLALFFYWATAYFTPIRSYYFIGIIFLFELIFFVFRKHIKYIWLSFLRLLPFFAIFYHFFIAGGDGRTGLIKDILIALAAHNFYIFYGFFSSLANLIFHDSITAKFFDIQVNIIRITSIGLPYVILGTIFLSILGLYFLFKGRKKSKRMIFLLSFVLLLWAIFSNQIFNVPVINLNDTTNYVTFLGGVVLIFSIAIIFVLNRNIRDKYIFLLLSLFISITAYWAYEPLVSLNTTHRYLVGAFSVLVCLFGFLFVSSKRPVKVLIIVWGLLNLVGSVDYQNQILNTRTFPVNSFYSQLKNELSKINKGDLLYFDLGDARARDTFQNAISTASMPNETAFAWRYGIDRYDLKITNSFSDFVSLIKSGNISFDSLHSFNYTNEKLVDTSSEMKALLNNGSLLTKVNFTSKSMNGGFEAELNNPIVGLTPAQVNLTLSATLPDLSKINFPYIHDSSFMYNSVAIDPELRKEAFEYLDAKVNLMRNAKVTVSSYWMTDIYNHLVDNDIQTNWRANRLSWKQENTNITVDLGRQYKIGEFVWINGFGNSTPVKYSLDISNDGKSWKTVNTTSDTKRIDSKDPELISFTPEKLRYIRMNFYETLDTDSPQISEIWTVPSDFDNLNVKDTEQFLNNPFGYVPDIESFRSTINNLKYSGKISLNDISEKQIIYDGIKRIYTFTLPAGGITISQLDMKNLQIPGNLSLENISYKNLSLEEIK